MEVRFDIGNPLLQVINEKVLQLARKFDTCWAASDDNHVKQPFDLFGSLVFEGRGLAAVHNTSPDGLSIVDLLEKERMLSNPRNTWKS
jgi:hypothetical protein